MKKWWALFKKEWVEMTRNYKVVWIPLVFILFGLLQPVTNYYMPEIMKNATNLPKGAVIHIPMPSSGEVLVQTLGQFNQMGVLVLVLAFMAIISGERKSGVINMILVKPVAYGSFISAKWLSAALLSMGSVSLGMVASWYYTKLLIGTLPFINVVEGTLVYSVWILLVITLTVFFSSFMKSSGIVAASTLLISILLSLATSLLKEWMKWSPAQLTNAAGTLLTKGTVNDQFIPVLFITFAIIAGLLFLSIKRWPNSKIHE